MIRAMIAAVLVLAALPAAAADKVEKAWKVYVQDVEGGPWDYHVGISGNDRCFVIMGAAATCNNAGLAGDFHSIKAVNPTTGETHVYLCERMKDLTEAQWQALDPPDCWKNF